MRRPLLLAALGSVLLAACAGAAAPSVATPGSSIGPNTAPSAAHPAVLRYEEGGGFVAPGFLVTDGPSFSLFGDATVIFRDPTAMPPANVGTVSFNTPYQFATITEDQIQALLQFAIGPGGLAAARASYQLPIADAPTTTFTLIAGSITKTTSINGLGLDVRPGPDAVILRQLASLWVRLQGFGNEILGERAWSPDRFRGILMDAHVASLRIAGIQGGARGILVLGPDGKTYELGIRALLPDENA
jgi:hypothetical protein